MEAGSSPGCPLRGPLLVNQDRVVTLLTSHTAQSYKKEEGEEGVGVTSRKTVLVEGLRVIAGARVGEPPLSKF